VCAGFTVTSPRPPHACVFHLCSSPCVPFIPPPSCLSCDVLQQTVVQRQTGLQRGPLAEHRLIITGVARLRTWTACSCVSAEAKKRSR
ncbi:hypothetical protein ATANTOWER_007248, partial [Ataeniobius toweri]|nr:hypothetical protein [Ataeniobius toweri]